MSDPTWGSRSLAEPAGTLSAENLETLEHLCRAIELADGFALFFARCNLPSQRDDLVARLAVLLERLGISSRRMDVQPVHRGLLADLQAACKDIPYRGCLQVCGLERLMPYGDPHPPILGQLNLARDRFRDLTCPVVFWLRDEALTRLAQGAPDFWAWRSGTFEFQPEPELVRAVHRQTQDDSSRWRNLPAEQKEEQITTLEGLLEDYKALGESPIEWRARAELLLDLADLYRDVYRWPAATWSLEEALRLAHSLDDRTLEARAFKTIGDVQRFRAENDAALQSYTQALALFRAVGDRLGEANTLQAMAPFAEDPVEVFSVAISLYEDIGDRYSVARGLYYFGLWLGEQGRTEEAQAALARSRDLFLAIGLPQVAGTVEDARQRIGNG